MAERLLAERVQRTAGLAAPPDVDVDGVPFLTQVVSGRYRKVTVEARDVPAGGSLRLARLTATLRGARVPLSDALSGDIASVPVERVDARALLPYDELSRRSGSRALTVSPAGGGSRDRVRVRGQVRVLGRDLTATAVSRVRVDDGVLVVRAESFEVGSGLADDLLTRVLHDRLDFRVRLAALPFGLGLQGVTAGTDGVLVSATARDTVLTGAA